MSLPKTMAAQFKTPNSGQTIPKLETGQGSSTVRRGAGRNKYGLLSEVEGSTSQEHAIPGDQSNKDSMMEAKAKARSSGEGELRNRFSAGNSTLDPSRSHTDMSIAEPRYIAESVSSHAGVPFSEGAELDTDHFGEKVHLELIIPYVANHSCS